MSRRVHHTLTRGRMLPEDEQRIQRKMLFIEEHVDGGKLVTLLFSEFVLDKNDKDEVLAGTSRLARTRTLMNIIFDRGEQAYTKFLAALKTEGYTSVVEAIESNYEDVEEAQEEVPEKETKGASSRWGHTVNVIMVMLHLLSRIRDLNKHLAEQSQPQDIRNLITTLDKITGSDESKESEMTEKNNVIKMVQDLGKRVEYLEKEKDLQAKRSDNMKAQNQELQGRVEEYEAKLKNLSDQHKSKEKLLKDLDQKITVLEKKVQFQQNKGSKEMKQGVKKQLKGIEKRRNTLDMKN